MAILLEEQKHRFWKFWSFVYGCTQCNHDPEAMF